MAAPETSTHRAASAARTGVVGTIVAAFAFFDAALLGMPIALLATSLRPLFVFAVGAILVTLLSIACCRWLDHRWDDWSTGHGARLEKRLDAMRGSRLMSRPVAWIQHGSDRLYALAAAIVNPILVVALARSVGGNAVGERRIVLGSAAYAVPYVAMWTFVGFALAGTISAL